MENILIEEVEKHNTIDDCWLISHGKVYDVTKFISRHPGGKFTIKSNSGKDVSHHFDYHSKQSHKIWKKYLIGELAKPCRCF